MAVNHAGNLAEKKREHPDAVFLEAPRIPRVRGGANVPQSMWLWPGIQLIGSCRVGHVMNGCFYTVKAVTDRTLELENGPVLTHASALHCLRLTYGLTMAGSQGLTLPGRELITDTDSRHFTRKHMFVATSRATAADLVEVE